jgi:hypothetical protein
MYRYALFVGTAAAFLIAGCASIDKRDAVASGENKVYVTGSHIPVQSGNPTVAQTFPFSGYPAPAPGMYGPASANGRGR